MTDPLTYAAAGVDVEAGDNASKRALDHARRTFGFRDGLTGQATQLDGVFTGLIDVGPFYLALNSDGVGSKALVAHAMGRYDTLGWDLLAMLADDAVCAGAEPTALVDTIDIQKVDAAIIDPLMKGLADACGAARVSIVGGEIAEMPDQISAFSWSGALIGLLKKDRVLGPHRVQAGDTVLGLLTDNFRANGYTLLRRILERAYGLDWHEAPYDCTQTWGDIALKPSKIFSPFISQLTGGFNHEPTANLSAVAHITGGGLEGNTARVLPKPLTIEWGTLPEPPEPMRQAMHLGQVTEAEARKAWNMGIGMAVITPSPNDVQRLAERMQVPLAELGKVVAR